MSLSSEPIGQVLVQRGLLTREQVKRVLQAQQAEPQRRPFGLIAGELCDLDEDDLMDALADQAARRSPSTRLARERIDPGCLTLIEPHEAWDHAVLPLRIERGTLICATTYETLPAAMRLLQRRIYLPFRFVIAEIAPLEGFIAERYRYEGVPVAD